LPILHCPSFPPSGGIEGGVEKTSTVMKEIPKRKRVCEFNRTPMKSKFGEVKLFIEGNKKTNE